jgi:hypothetical protein
MNPRERPVGQVPEQGEDRGSLTCLPSGIPGRGGQNAIDGAACTTDAPWASSPRDPGTFRSVRSGTIGWPDGHHSPMTDQMNPMKMKIPAKSPTKAGGPTVLADRFRLARKPIASIHRMIRPPKR